MFDHLIFDFDGTISDSYPLFLKFFHTIAEQNKLPFLLTDEELEHQLRLTVRDGFRALGWEKLISYRKVIDMFHGMQEEYALQFRAFPEAVDLLQYAVAQGKRVYLYTHTDNVVHQMLKHMGIDSLFTFVLDASFGFPTKPAPDALRYLANTLSLDPKACLMIGDRPIDAHAGMNAGMAGCLWDLYRLYPNAVVDYRVSMLSEIKALI